MEGKHGKWRRGAGDAAVRAAGGGAGEAGADGAGGRDNGRGATDAPHVRAGVVPGGHGGGADDGARAAVAERSPGRRARAAL